MHATRPRFLAAGALALGLAACQPARPPAPVPQQSPPPLRFVNPDALATPRGYTHMVEANGGRMLFLAGQVALDVNGNLVGAGDIVAQAEQVFENLSAALAAAGAGFDDVVKIGVYLTDFSQLDDLREVRDRYVDVERPPASTAVGVSRLFREEFLLEIDAIAVVAE